MNKGKLTAMFFGGTGMVTGSNFVLDLSEGEKRFRTMIDCGLIQGGREKERENHRAFPYDPPSVNILLVTHAHLDHIGRVPKLVKDGFKGTIFSTPETKELATLMFNDALSIMSFEKSGGHPPLYSEEDVEKTFSLWKTEGYYKAVSLTEELSFRFINSGHILGSAMVEFNHDGKKVVFTGDIGNSPSLLLKEADIVNDAEYLVMESVYGNRNHEGVEERTKKLAQIVKETKERGGTLLIPAFSIERTQILLFELNNLFENGSVPEIPVFLDSPLGIAVTDVYHAAQENFNEGVQKQIQKGDDIFSFNKLKFTLSQRESRTIWKEVGPKIIIAGAGMSHGGRILLHEEKYLDNPQNTILFVGYQSPGTAGRHILDGLKKVTILGKEIRVRARIESIFSYSAHRDSDGLLAFAEAAQEKVKKIFVVMGEPQSSLFFAQRLKDYLGVAAVVPEVGKEYLLD